MLLPALTVCDAGEAEIVKSGLLMMNVTVVEWTVLPLVPVIVNVYVPGAATLPAIIFSEDVPEPPVTDAGVNTAVVPAGLPVTDKLTVLLKPFTLPMVTVYTADCSF